MGVGLGCTNLGFSYAGGNGIKQNYKKAIELLSKACNMKEAIGCYNLGSLYINGQGIRQNKKVAKEYFGKACDLGDQDGCDWYKKLNR